jgi:hypothetical protein
MGQNRERQNRGQYTHFRFLVALAAVAAALAPPPARAEIIDRIAVTVDKQVITQSQIIGDIRTAAFLNGETPDLGAASKRSTAERLIDQLLVEREMELTRYPQPAPSDIEETLKQVKGRLGGEAPYQAALEKYGIDDRELRHALLRQARFLRFIDLRFKPEVQVEESQLQRYYDDVLRPAYVKKGAKPPSYDEARSECEEAVAGELVDRRVEAWLKDARSRARIVYEDDAFR